MIAYQPGTVDPSEYDFEEQFSALSTLEPFTLMDTGKVLGLAIAYQSLLEEVLDLRAEVLNVRRD